MNRIENIKDITKVKVRGDMLFCEVFEPTKSGLYLPESAQGKSEGVDKLVVIKAGESITDVEEGDVVLMFHGTVTIFSYREKMYGFIQRYNCDVIVSQDNFTE